ncbi:protein-L-isoaspartate O-methyltransferase family protein [Thiohalobacter thiocyanaticus]|uniref:Protein-L-isoaspartate O-methyltransferase n=1 Tax=Thiohalobacter thiocyanaticus TaxID=585455 RepID=A0A426QIN2_9GAMM|nr:protein-L-isoaspartate O-methyltransferase [Thiohalobacter thiocyanaticus]RRQ21605.1 protein-L-isoaspartate O-methyltransferase [Thiohalobacter thiocyanaticus]
MSEQADTVDFERARYNMIEQQIRPWEVLDQRVLDVLMQTPREDFVPPQYRSTLAFSDISLPLEHGQVMLPPKLEGRLLQSLAIRPTDRILEVGTGSGYLTACLARLGREVLSLDLYADFKYAAERKLEQHGITNVELRTDDAASGWGAEQSFDAIAVTGSLPLLHRGFHNALAVGGRLFVIVGKPPVMEAMLITRVAADQWAAESLFDTSAPPLENAPRIENFDF